MSVSSCPVTGRLWEDSVWFSLFHLLDIFTCYLDCLSHFCFPGWIAWALSISSCEMLQSLSYLSAPLLDLHVHVSLLLRSPDLDKMFQKCLTRAEQREKISSFNLFPAMLLLIQPGGCYFFATMAHCWVRINVVSIRTLRASSAMLWIDLVNFPFV